MRVKPTIFDLETKKSELNNTSCTLIINGKEIDLVIEPNSCVLIYHIYMCKRNISSGNYVLKSLNNILTTSVPTTIYYMLLGYAYKSYLYMIKMLQKKNIQNVHKTKYNDHTMHLFHISKKQKI